MSVHMSRYTTSIMFSIVDNYVSNCFAMIFLRLYNAQYTLRALSHLSKWSLYKHAHSYMHVTVPL